MDRQTIIDTYNRIEEESGGLANADPKQTVARTAQELGIEYEDARSVMIDHWTMAGS